MMKSGRMTARSRYLEQIADIRVRNKFNPPAEARNFYYFDELVKIFNYSSRQSADVSVRRGCFPVHTYKKGGRRVADKDVVKTYFQEQYDLGIAELYRPRML